ncbi:MAG: hypothetical protein ACTSU8_04830 [Alphaproteobacteria bacterium]
MSKTDKVASVLLWPGNKVCDLLSVEGDDHRLILRLWVNLVVYSIVSLSIVLVVVD